MKFLTLISIYLCSLCVNADVKRLYISPHNENGNGLHGIQHHFPNGVISIEVNSHEHRELVNNKDIDILEYASPWELSRHVKSCQPWPSCKNDPPPPPSSRIYFPNDQTPWGIEEVYNDPLIASTSGGAGVTVAVLDTGANIEHLDLVGRVTQCKDFTKRKVPNSCSDSNGHGTHVAGTIAADGGTDGLGIYGVAPESSLFIYRVCSRYCWSDDVSAAIIHATDQGANIISMSLGGPSLASIERDAIDYAVANGVLVIAAAGNSGPTINTIGYPAAYFKVMAIAALDSSIVVTSWSSRGINDGDFIIDEREVEIAMPGSMVESSLNDGGYYTISGTSMSTPHASGFAAKFWQGDSGTTRQWIQDRAKLYDIILGLHADLGDDPASGFGFPTI